MTQDMINAFCVLVGGSIAMAMFTYLNMHAGRTSHLKTVTLAGVFTGMAVLLYGVWLLLRAAS